MLLSEAGQPVYLTSRVLLRGGSVAPPFHEIFRDERSHETRTGNKRLRKACYQSALAEQLIGGRSANLESVNNNGQSVKINQHLFSNSNLSKGASSIPQECTSSMSSKSNHTDNMPVTFDVQKPSSEPGVCESKRVMCLMSDTGGGHRASAQALKDCFELVHGNQYAVHIVDLWTTCSPWPFNRMPSSYFFLVKNPWLWRLNFRCSEPRFIHEVMFKGYTSIVSKYFARAFSEIDPDLIISVHPLMQHVPLKVLRQMKNHPAKKRVAFATVVTDLTRCHTTWFHQGVDKCFVATNLVAAQALRLGLRSQQIECHGLPVRPSFSAPVSCKRDLRAKLGLDIEAPTVMLVGGGEGMGKLKETAEALAQTLQSTFQVVVICGRNTRLSDFLRGRSWPLKMVVKGFVNNMAEYMGACDCVISKAGPGTIAEAMICGVPIVLNGCIPCQEEGNIPFVIENQVGAYSELPHTIAQVVAGWLAPENVSELQAMSSRARALGRPEATFDIIRDLVDLLHKA